MLLVHSLSTLLKLVDGIFSFFFLSRCHLCTPHLPWSTVPLFIEGELLYLFGALVFAASAQRMHASLSLGSEGQGCLYS